MQTTRQTSNLHLQELGGRGTTFPAYTDIMAMSNVWANSTINPLSRVPFNMEVQAQLSMPAARDGVMEVDGLRIRWQTLGAFGTLRNDVMERSVTLVLPDEVPAMMEGSFTLVSSDPVETWAAEATLVPLPTAAWARFSDATEDIAVATIDGRPHLVVMDDYTVSQCNAASGVSSMTFLSDSISNTAVGT